MFVKRELGEVGSGYVEGAASAEIALLANNARRVESMRMDSQRTASTIRTIETNPSSCQAARPMNSLATFGVDASGMAVSASISAAVARDVFPTQRNKVDPLEGYQLHHDRHAVYFCFWVGMGWWYGQSNAWYPA